MDQEECTYIQEGNPTIEHFCSLNLWTMMCKEIWPQTKLSTNDLETKLSEIIFATCDTSVPTLITKMLDIKHQIKAEKGVTYKPDCFMMLLFNKLSWYNIKMPRYEFIAARSAYNNGKMTHDKVFEALKLFYRTEQAAGTWANLMSSKLEITMLTTNLAKANNELHKIKSLGGCGGGAVVGAGTVVVVEVGLSERAMAIMELKRAVAVPTARTMNGCSQGPLTLSSIPPKART